MGKGQGASDAGSATERCPLCGTRLARGRLQKHLRKAHPGEGLVGRPGLAAPEETGEGKRGARLLRCSLCGATVREDRYAAHVRKAHPPRRPAPGPANDGPTRPERAGAADESKEAEKLRRQLEDLKDRLRQVNATLKQTRGPAKREKLLAKKRALKSRINSLDLEREPPRFKTWGRWSKGPASVRFWRGR